MTTIRSSSASFSRSCRNLRNSARFVCATIVSSTWMSGKRDAFVAEFGDLGQVDRAHEIGVIRGRRIVRRVSAYAHASRLGDEDPLDRHAHEVAAELLVDANAAGGA